MPAKQPQPAQPGPSLRQRWLLALAAAALLAWIVLLLVLAIAY